MVVLAKTYENATLRDTGALVFDPEGGAAGAYPMRPFGVRLASGMVHWFESEIAARNSQYGRACGFGVSACARCGERWPCSDSARTDIRGDERAAHVVSR